VAKSRQILTGLAFTVVLLITGFFCGMHFNQQRSSPPEAPTLANQAAPAPPSPVINNTAYQASPPSKGHAYRSTVVPLENIGNHAAIVYLKKDQANGVAAGQPVLLYDKANLRLNIIGKVTSVAQGREKFSDIAAVTIAIADTPETPARKIASGEIIIEEFSSVDRLPLSALQKNADGTPYVWEIITQPDGSMKTAKRDLQSALVVNGNFFVMKNDNYVSDLYLLNPDASVQDAQPITVSRTLYQAPDVGNPEDIAMMREDAMSSYRYEMQQLPLINQIHAGNVGVGGCPTPPKITADFIAKVKSLADQDTAGKPANP